MPKGKPGRGVKARAAAKPAASVAHGPGRRLRSPDEPAQSTRSRSDAMRLAAEVERLERELAAARQQMAALELRADIDPLTDLPNRRAFERELGRSLAYVKRHGTSAALLYLDLDGFKAVNDRDGHAAGDAVLKAVASVLKRHVRASDVVARIGGDEFALLLWNCGEDNAIAKAWALEEAIGRTTATYRGRALAAAASVGAGMLLPLDRPAETLARADGAMYARKAIKRRVHAAE
jgi:diguanylate cyclase (GGDEF)-like protein